MKWQEVCEHPSLRNLPFKLELNERGQVVMTPVKVYHSAYQGRITRLLSGYLGSGEILEECAIHTARGTKVADVAWVSADRFAMVKTEAECSIAPEICVEVLSDSNSEEEMTEKRALYFAAGASEVWLCGTDGRMRFYHATGQIAQSGLVPDFPECVA